MERQIDFSKIDRPRQPTRKEAARYRRWIKYLKGSRLTEGEIRARAASFTQQKRDP